MATKQVGVWGIDLGQCALKAVRIVEQDGKPVATAFDYVEHPKILSQPDADPDQLIREALNKFLERNNLRGDIVCISVPGQSGLARFVKLPPVEEKKISDIVKFEAKQQIPFNLDEVVWDYQKLSAGMVTDGFALDTEIGLFAMKRDMVSRYLDHFKEVKVEVHIVQMAPLALCNFVSYDLLGKKAGVADEAVAGKKKCIVALDIGTDSSNLVVTDGARIIWQRPIPLGGNHFTRALTKDLKLTFAKAEHLKRNATKSPDLKKILTALKPVLSDFVGEVQRSLGFFTNSHRDAEIQYMVGLGNAFRLPGLQRFMTEKLQLEVRKLSKLEQLGGEPISESVFQENILSFAVSYGLALQGLKQARLLTNLLPPEIRVERMIRAKKPWAVAAAAALLFGFGFYVWGDGSRWSAYGDPEVDAAKKTGAATIAKVGAAELAFNSQKTATENEKNAINSVVAGQPERKNWLELQRFVGEVVPRPDQCTNPKENLYGTFIPDIKKIHKTLLLQDIEQWNREGYVAYERRLMAEGRPGAGSKPTVTLADDPTIGLDRLVQFNIVGVDCRYTDDLSIYWKALPPNVLDKGQERVRPMSDLDTPPGEKEKGWIVEMRGYTFHHKKDEIVKHVLLERIAQLGNTKPPTPLSVPPAPEGGAPMGDPAPKKDRVVSHVALIALHYTENTTHSVSSFAIAGQSQLAVLQKNLETPPPATGMGMGGDMGSMGPVLGVSGGGGMGNTPMGGRPGWTPVSAKSSASGAMGAMGGGGIPPISGGNGGSFQPPSGGFMGAMGGGPMGTIKDNTGKLTRTEFIVFFIWREPTPSDNALAFPGGSESGQ